MADQHPLGMSDEDFANLSAPPEPATETPAVTPLTEEVVTPPAVVEESVVPQTQDELSDAEKAAAAYDGEDDDKVLADEAKPELVDPTKDKPGEQASAAVEPKLDADGKLIVEKPAVPADEKGEKPATSEEVVAAPDAPALADFYNKVMKPFKANGKMIELKSPEEAISLMQMGANYTRKLQDIQPQRKLLLMLQNNDLLDEGKLSFAIDLMKGDPAAVRQLIKDVKIDPLDINVEEDSGYLPGSHQVSDQEANFRSVVGEVSSTPKGKETVTEINTTWDEVSKDALWNSPEIMTAIHDQRENGVYDTIKAEVDRRKLLGQIPTTMPFLEAYTAVGDELVAQTRSQGAETPAIPVGEKTPQVVTTRAAAPKSPLANSDKASAASATRSSPTAAKTFVNPLAESDEEFMKRMEGRL